MFKTVNVQSNKTWIPENSFVLTLNVPIPDKVKKLSEVFIFTLLLFTHKTFCGTTKKCENKNLTQFFHFARDWTVKC